MGGGNAQGAGDYVYVYGVTRNQDGALAAALTEGVLPETPVKLAPVGALAAVYSPVPAAEFASVAVKGVEDPAWVSERVVAHHRVLDACAREFVIAPVKFGAVRRCLADVEELVAANSAAFLATLDRVEGAREWGAKLYGDLDACRSAIGESGPALEPLRADLETAAPGRAFFLRKKMLELADAEARSSLAVEAGRVHEFLSAQAREAAQMRTSQTAGDGRCGTLVLSAAYLVDKSNETGFHEALEEVRATLPAGCFTLKLTGPWPPYSFVDVKTGGIGRDENPAGQK